MKLIKISEYASLVGVSVRTLKRRIKRGLFKTATKKLINADLNGSLNILRKVIGEFQYPIKVCSTPLVLTIK